MPLHRGSPRNEFEREARELVSSVLKDAKRLAELVEHSAQAQGKLDRARQLLDEGGGHS